MLLEIGKDGARVRVQFLVPARLYLKPVKLPERPVPERGRALVDLVLDRMDHFKYVLVFLPVDNVLIDVLPCDLFDPGAKERKIKR